MEMQNFKLTGVGICLDLVWDCGVFSSEPEEISEMGAMHF